MMIINCFEDFRRLLVQDLEFFRYPVDDLIQRYGSEYMEDSVPILRWLEVFAERNGSTFKEVLSQYGAYVRRAAQEYRDFQKTGDYQSTLSEGVNRQIEDPVLQLDYLYILTLSTPLNRSRYEVFRHFRATAKGYLLPGSRMLEIGAGNCLDALFASQYAHVDAYELNPFSTHWQQILNLKDRVSLNVKWYDFDAAQPYDFVAMVELLEHLSDPRQYLEGAHRVLKTGGCAYFTFAIRMPQFDHLFQFNSIEECQDMVCGSGFRIADEFCTISTYLSFEEHERWQLASDSRYAVIYCCLAQKIDSGQITDLLDDFTQPCVL